MIDSQMSMNFQTLNGMKPHDKVFALMATYTHLLHDLSSSSTTPSVRSTPNKDDGQQEKPDCQVKICQQQPHLIIDVLHVVRKDDI